MRNCLTKKFRHWGRADDRIIDYRTPRTPFKGFSSRHPESKAETQMHPARGISEYLPARAPIPQPPPQPIRRSRPHILSNIPLLCRPENMLLYHFQAEVTAHGIL
ncbi:hypothetical protein AVEN_121642-1 [Araneus ventricosus]|uniref:Uncharacterized protein n=1 Tax=Araneus ventricosus TaxID=182803 RepID=A0A4Y2KWS5_ARAVE|nr:hypothetical protein AVEN_121642-1 [Araneus ventricosus]